MYFDIIAVFPKLDVLSLHCLSHTFSKQSFLSNDGLSNLSIFSILNMIVQILMIPLMLCLCLMLCKKTGINFS